MVATSTNVACPKLLASLLFYYIAHRPTTTMLWLHYAPSTTLSHREIVVTVGILVIFFTVVIDHRLLSVLHLVKV